MLRASIQFCTGSLHNKSCCKFSFGSRRSNGGLLYVKFKHRRADFLTSGPLKNKMHAHMILFYRSKSATPTILQLSESGLFEFEFEYGIPNSELTGRIMKIVNCLQILKIFWTPHKITAGCKLDYRDWRGGGDWSTQRRKRTSIVITC